MGTTCKMKKINRVTTPRLNKSNKQRASATTNSQQVESTESTSNIRMNLRNNKPMDKPILVLK